MHPSVIHSSITHSIHLSTVRAPLKKKVYDAFRHVIFDDLIQLNSSRCLQRRRLHFTLEGNNKVTTELTSLIREG